MANILDPFGNKRINQERRESKLKLFNIYLNKLQFLIFLYNRTWHAETFCYLFLHINPSTLKEHNHLQLYAVKANPITQRRII